METLFQFLGWFFVGALCVLLGYVLAQTQINREVWFGVTNIQRILTGTGGVMALLDALKDEVARNTSVDESAIVLIQGLAAKIQELIDAGADPAALQALVDSLKASTDSLAGAVAANTPAEEPTP